MSRDVHNYLPPDHKNKRIPAEVFGQTRDVKSEKIRLVQSSDGEIERKACEFKDTVD